MFLFMFLFMFSRLGGGGGQDNKSLKSVKQGIIFTLNMIHSYWNLV